MYSVVVGWYQSLRLSIASMPAMVSARYHTARVSGLSIGVCHDHTAYEFCDLWDYSVSESFKSVHPSGNPISHSTHIGFSRPPVSSGLF